MPIQRIIGDYIIQDGLDELSIRIQIEAPYRRPGDDSAEDKQRISAKHTAVVEALERFVGALAEKTPIWSYEKRAI